MLPSKPKLAMGQAARLLMAQKLMGSVISTNAALAEGDLTSATYLGADLEGANTLPEGVGDSDVVRRRVKQEDDIKDAVRSRKGKPTEQEMLDRISSLPFDELLKGMDRLSQVHEEQKQEDVASDLSAADKVVLERRIAKAQGDLAKISKISTPGDAWNAQMIALTLSRLRAMQDGKIKYNDELIFGAPLLTTGEMNEIDAAVRADGLKMTTKPNKALVRNLRQVLTQRFEEMQRVSDNIHVKNVPPLFPGNPTLAKQKEKILEILAANRAGQDGHGVGSILPDSNHGLRLAIKRSIGEIIAGNNSLQLRANLKRKLASAKTRGMLTKDAFNKAVAMYVKDLA